MNLVFPVQFSSTMISLLDTAQSNDLTSAPPVLVEIGPHSALRGPIREIIAQHAKDSDTRTAVYLSTLQRNEEGCSKINAFLASVVSMGWPVVFDKTIDGNVLVDLPSYQFDLDESYWHKSRLQDAALYSGSPWNAILGHRMGSTVGEDLQFRHVFALDDIPWLADHSVDGSIIFPMAGYISAITEALRHHATQGNKTTRAFDLREVVISKAFLVSEEGDNEMFTTLRRARGESRSSSATDSFSFEVLSWTERSGFVEHCRGFAQLVLAEHGDEVGELVRQKLDADHSQQLQNRVRSSCLNQISGHQLYEAAAQRGFRYGSAFQGVTSLKTGVDSAYGNIRRVDTSARMPAGFKPEILIHPAWLDAALHVDLCNLGGNQGELRGIRANVPAFLESIRIQTPSTHHCTDNAKVFVHNVHCSTAASSTLADISVIYPDQPLPIIEICGLRMFQTSEDSGEEAETAASNADILNPLTVEWLPHPEFIPSLRSVAAAIGGVDDEQFRRQDLERWSLYMMDEALTVTPNTPRASHLRKMYNWMHRVVNPQSSQPQYCRWSEWLAASVEDRRVFKETFRRERADMWHWVHVGERLPMILREELDPLEVLMQDGMLFNIYEETSIFQRTFSSSPSLWTCSRDAIPGFAFLRWCWYRRLYQ